MSERDFRQRLEDVREELLSIDEDLPEPLTLTPALRCIDATRGAVERLGHGRERP